MKKVVLAVIAASLVLCLTACGGGASSSEPEIPEGFAENLLQVEGVDNTAAESIAAMVQEKCGIVYYSANEDDYYWHGEDSADYLTSGQYGLQFITWYQDRAHLMNVTYTPDDGAVHFFTTMDYDLDTGELDYEGSYEILFDDGTLQ